MWNNKLCLGLSGLFEIPYKEQVKLLHDVGFEAFFANWLEIENVAELKEYADSLGMIFQSVHAPFYKADAMWEGGEAAEEATEELLQCLDDCAAGKIPIVVCHVFKGFGEERPNEIGVENYRKVVEKAKEYGIKIAFENTEGEKYLAAIMDAFKDYDNVGFCFDTGHEMCYNYSKDMLALYGDRLLCTHLNDNLGIKDFNGKITPADDLHLLPFDGVADWEDIVHRLNKCGYNDILTFELNKQKPARRENDVYARMPIEEYITEVYKRACRVAVLKQRDLK